MRERTIETYLAEQAEQLGGLAAKHVSPGRAGDPDRLVVLPRPACPCCGRAYTAALVEVKRPGEAPRPDQVIRLQQWRDIGMPAGWASTQWEVDEILKDMVQRG